MLKKKIKQSDAEPVFGEDYGKLAVQSKMQYCKGVELSSLNISV